MSFKHIDEQDFTRYNYRFLYCLPSTEDAIRLLSEEGFLLSDIDVPVPYKDYLVQKSGRDIWNEMEMMEESYPEIERKISVPNRGKRVYFVIFSHTSARSIPFAKRKKDYEFIYCNSKETAIEYLEKKGRTWINILHMQADKEYCAARYSIDTARQIANWRKHYPNMQY